MTGAMPSRNAGPACVLQHDERNHQIAAQSQSSAVAIYSSSKTNECILSGVRRKKIVARIPPAMGARRKKIRSQRCKGVRAMERQIKLPSSALLAAAVAWATIIASGSMENTLKAKMKPIRIAHRHPKVPPKRTQGERAYLLTKIQLPRFRTVYAISTHPAG